eukprot:258223-Rhodomonas_salina.2
MAMVEIAEGARSTHRDGAGKGVENPSPKTRRSGARFRLKLSVSWQQRYFHHKPFDGIWREQIPSDLQRAAAHLTRSSLEHHGYQAALEVDRRQCLSSLQGDLSLPCSFDWVLLTPVVSRAFLGGCVKLSECMLLAVQEVDLGSYFSRKVAVDASMSMYQFLIAMQRPDGTNMLTNDAGEVTSHLNGLMMRTAKMLENNIKPVYVFDGKPPDLKKGTLDDRKEKREEADAALAKAREEGDDEVRCGEICEEDCARVQGDDGRRQDVAAIDGSAGALPALPPPPHTTTTHVIEAPTEAEAQCAILAKAGIVHAAVSEDMDTLTFGAPVCLRPLKIPFESHDFPLRCAWS